MAQDDARNPRQNEALGLGAAEPFEPIGRIEPVEGAEIVPGAASAIEWLNDPAAATQRALKSDPDVARQFLLATGRPVHHLIAFPSLSGPPSGGWAVDVTDDAAWAAAVSEMAARNRAKNGIYWHVNPVRAEAGSKSKYGKADIEQVDWLHLDLDPDLPKGSTADEYLDTTARLLASTTAFVKRGHMPTLAVMSGNGIQLLYRLAEPLTVDEGEAAVAKLQTVVNAMDGISCSGTQNADRVLRVPGFINWANAKKMKQGYPKQIMSERLKDDPSGRTTLEALLDGEAVSEGPRANAAPAAAQSAPVPAPAPPVGPAGPVPVVPAHLAGWMALKALPDEAGNFLIDAATDADKAKRRRRATVQSGDNDGAKLDAAMTWHAEWVKLGERYASAVEGEAFTGDRSKCLMAQAKICAEAGRTFLQFVHIVVTGGGAGLAHAFDQGGERMRARALRRAWETTDGEDFGITDHRGASEDLIDGDAAAPAPKTTAGDEVLDDDGAEEVVLTPEQVAALDRVAAMVKDVDPLQPPGVLGEIVEWGWRNGHMDNREIALAGAISGLGGLVGNDVYIRVGGKNTGMTMTQMVLAESGAGKQNAINICSSILFAMGRITRLTEPVSGPGLHSALLRQGGAVTVNIDEAGAYMAALKMDQGGGHKKELMEKLKQVWSIGTGVLPGTSASKERDCKAPVMRPSASVMLLSTIEAMAPALTGQQTADGLLNRMLLILSLGERKVMIRGKDDGGDTVAFPIQLVAKLSHLSEAAIAHRGTAVRPLPQDVSLPAFAALTVNTADVMGITVSPEVQALYDDVGRYALARGKEVAPVAKPLWVRPQEIALRLAGLAAAADNKAVIDLPTMRWATALALASSEAFTCIAVEHIADTKEAAAEQRIMAYMWKDTDRGRLRGDGRLNRADVCRNCKGGQITYARARQALVDLIAQGLLDGPDVKTVTLSSLGRRRKP